AGVPHGEPLARRSGAEELAAGRAVEHGVADEARVARVVGRRRHHDPPAGHRLADVVVRLADEPELDARGEERTKALTRGPLEARSDTAGRRPGANRARNRAAEAGTDRAIAVRDLEGRLDEPCAADRRPPLGVEERAQAVALVRHDVADVARGTGPGAGEEAPQVERVGGRVACPALPEEIGATDGLVECPEAEAGE